MAQKVINSKTLAAMESELVTSVYNALSALLSKGCKVKYDFVSGRGFAHYKGKVLAFTCGSENLYIDLSFHTKCVPEETIEKVADLLDFADNYSC